MKRIFILIPVILLSACATKRVVVQMPHAIPGTTLKTENLESIRYGENLKTYPIGRYVDPNNQFVMHESHTVYRVETTAKWNLHPNAPVHVPTGPVVQIIDPAHRNSPVTPEIVAEVNRQKNATKALIEQGDRMNHALTRLSQNVSVAKQMAEENAQLKRQFVSANERLETLEIQFRKSQTETLTSPGLPAKGTDDW